MKLNNYIIRRVDSRNIIVHKDMGKDKKGDWKVDQDHYFHSTLFGAVKKVRQLVQNKHIAIKAEASDVLRTLKHIDLTFLEELRSIGLKELTAVSNVREAQPNETIKQKKKASKKKVYIASGWFTEEQDNVLKEIETEIQKQSKYDFFAPRLQNNGTLGCDWDKIIQRNIDELDTCDYMIASTIGKDIGTLTEVGRFQQMGKPVIFYAPGLSGPFNLMLAKDAQRVCINLEELKQAIIDLSIKSEYKGEIE